MVGSLGQASKRWWERNRGLLVVWASGAAFWVAELSSGMRGLDQTWNAEGWGRLALG